MVKCTTGVKGVNLFNSAGADGGPRSRDCARLTLCSEMQDILTTYTMFTEDGKMHYRGEGVSFVTTMILINMYACTSIYIYVSIGKRARGTSSYLYTVNDFPLCLKVRLLGEQDSIYSPY